MCHKMSEVRGWTHNDMMCMPQPVFYRYYGYYQQDKLREEAYYERQDAERKAKAKLDNQR